MPSKDFHSCDINTNLKVVGTQKRSHAGKPYNVRIGVPRGKKGGSSDYAYYYSKGVWTVAKARAHCKAHGGSFKAALKE